MEEGKTRNRDHIEAILNSDGSTRPHSAYKDILDELVSIYKSSIKPLEDAYKFSHLKHRHNPFSDIHAKPSLLVLGPRSSGKTSMINYILGLEGPNALRVGVDPTSSDFVIIDHGPRRKMLPGTAILADESKPYAPLAKYGMTLAANLHGAEFPVKLLSHLTVIDTPGLMENSDHQMQGHHYIEVSHWFITRASLIFFVFDPSKLDAGKKLREVFRRLKGHEGKLRIILNKADSVDGGMLLKTYGAFCWNLKGLIPNLADPPRVYLVSCWSNNYKGVQYKDALVTEEISLVQDIKQAIDMRGEAVISSLLEYALSVETHAIIVDAYFSAYDEHKHNWLRWKNGALQTDLVDCPDLFNIPERVGAKTSNHDGFLNVLVYRQFFLANPISTFYRASHSRNGVIFSGATVLEKAQEAIKTTIPHLLAKQRALRSQASLSESHKSETTGIAILTNTVKTLLSPRQQLRMLLVKSPLSSSWIPSPLGFVTEKVQGALKSY